MTRDARAIRDRYNAQCHEVKVKTEPIRVGDKLIDPQGFTWEVIETRPGGHVDLFDRDRTRFLGMYHKQVKDWLRDGRVVVS